MMDIASKVTPSQVQIEQAVMAIYEANPQAFNGSVNNLFAGSQLFIPSTEHMQQYSHADAEAKQWLLNERATNKQRYKLYQPEISPPSQLLTANEALSSNITQQVTSAVKQLKSLRENQPSDIAYQSTLSEVKILI